MLFVHNYEEMEEVRVENKKLQGQGFSIFRGTIIGFACIIIIRSLTLRGKIHLWKSGEQ